MKVSIQNLLGLERNLSKPNGITFNISSYGTIKLIDKDKYERFYLGYNNHDCLVKTQLEELEVTSVEGEQISPTTDDATNFVSEQQELSSNNTESPANEQVSEPVDEQANSETTAEQSGLNKEEIVKHMQELSVDQLKSIATTLGVATSANKAGALINKILNASDLESINNAMTSIKGDE